MTTAPRLTNERIDIALKLLDGWTGKLTWSRFLAILELDLGHKYTKAALLRHSRFKNTWDKRRWIENPDRNEKNNFGNSGLQTAFEKIEKLERTIERLENDNNILTEKFVVWSTNAANKGISLEELNRPLPTHSIKNTS
ncbi:MULTISPECIES: hypothetical protein [Acinetobacter calcoaceticus/baumannii complex]|uniref:hypothetical protein n=1 Tax=Acinetobacter calcoaceticus/baumannii complex TaxID=909768 RepID=UPI001BCD9064|nr:MULTISPECIES: hypothetical protein [Acinetobacter calcoaceticus/baumannii complex]MCF1294616.1 hypothetical protein [Acinetobacter nosocomialis]MCF1297459.1 hypothetical protein [Acinetobacter nosocomialis]